jgi:hypothetical protein
MADVILTIPPQSQTVAHRWRTSIQKNVAGGEKRSALFTWPRIVLRNTIAPIGSREINWLKRKIIRYSDAIWGIPVWADITELTAQAAEDQEILAVAETADRHFYADRQCILINPADPFEYEVGTIDAIAPAQITLVANLAATWPAGSWVFPLYECRIAADHEVTRPQSNRREIEIEATEAYETLRTFSYELPVSGAPTYLKDIADVDIDLFLHPIEEPVTYKYSRPYDLLQFLGLGYAASRFAAGENALGMKTKLVRSTRAQIRETFDFFDACQGRLQMFWMPSWNRDIVATQAILDTDTVINCEDIDYSTHYLPNEIIGRHVYIEFPGGTYACRKIVDAAAATVTLDSAIGTAVPAVQLERLLISFLNLSRFDLDELAIDYPLGGGEYGQMDLSVMGLVGETVEEEE